MTPTLMTVPTKAPVASVAEVKLNAVCQVATSRMLRRPAQYMCASTIDAASMLTNQPIASGPNNRKLSTSQKNGRCQPAQPTPTTNAVHLRSWSPSSRSTAKPRQPISSPNPLRMSTTAITADQE